MIGPRALETEPAIARRFEALEVLDQGALGSVHRVRDRRGGELCRLVLASAASVDPRALPAQLELARRLVRFEHPRVAPLLAADESSLGPFLVYREIPGSPLRHLLTPGSPPLLLAEALELGRQMAEILASLHGLDLSAGSPEPAPGGWIVAPAPSDFVLRRPPSLELGEA
ncbi:MAG: phosphotransferase, partial [Holophagales bacterium]|nr:phosphotransferase [Holophagales bacterium]